ncbi:synaptotagmin-2 [Artemisia annua]|uniref:Synaptotagmin-2 n=1 Tax=Artemisia annua TaxID=35608 RepID=A0A2U1MMP0_ARTAN|nr:synaptotagmin-2 [Artemisia annua]
MAVTKNMVVDQLFFDQLLFNHVLFIPTFIGRELSTFRLRTLSEHIKKNRDPRWNEEFKFTLEEPPVNDKLPRKPPLTAAVAGNSMVYF